MQISDFLTQRLLTRMECRLSLQVKNRITLRNFTTEKFSRVLHVRLEHTTEKTMDHPTLISINLIHLILSVSF